MTLVVMQVTQADAHVAMDVIRDGNRETDSQNAVGERQRVEIAIAQKEQTGEGSPDEREDCEHRVGDVSQGEEQRHQRDGPPTVRNQAKHARQEITLQKELLHERPDEVSPDVGEEGRLAKE